MGCLPAVRLIRNAIPLWVGLITASAAGDPPAQDPPIQCANPTSAPALSFSLLGYRKGDLDHKCGESLRRARAFGFTAVTIVPAHIFDTNSNSLMTRESATSTYCPSNGGAGRGGVRYCPMPQGELSRCMDQALAMGFDIQLKPHLETIETLTGRGEMDWRARFPLRPDDTFRREAFGEIIEWMNRNRAAINSGNRRIDIIAAGELEESTARYPVDWIRTITDLRNPYLHGFEGRVRIGMNPNWHPMSHPTDCTSYRQLISAFDYVAPSFYGDWSDGLNQGQRQAANRRQQVLNSLSKSRGSCGRINEFYTRTFAVGEFGVGGNLRATEQEVMIPRPGEASPPTPQGKVSFTTIEQRRRVYANLLQWAEQGATRGATPPPPINLWTAGVFDPVGVTRSSCHEINPDPRIAETFRSYTRRRCGITQFPDLPSTDCSGPAPPPPSNSPQTPSAGASNEASGSCPAPASEPISQAELGATMQDLDEVFSEF